MCGSSNHGPQYYSVKFYRDRKKMDPWPGEETITYYQLKPILTLTTYFKNPNTSLSLTQDWTTL